MYILVLSLIVVLSYQSALAETVSRDSGNQGTNSKAQYLLKQISSENTSLKEQIKALEAKLESKETTINKLKQSVSNKNKSIKSRNEVMNRYQKTVKSQQSRIELTREKFNQLVVKYRELVKALKVLEAERAESHNKINIKQAKLELCNKNNKELAKTASNILDEYENKGIWDALLQKEPVTQLKRVEVENYTQKLSKDINELQVRNIE
jgi:chromosome segregation ATPase